MTLLTIIRGLANPTLVLFLAAGCAQLPLSPASSSAQDKQDSKQVQKRSTGRAAEQPPKKTPPKQTEKRGKKIQSDFQKDSKKILPTFDKQGILGRIRMAWHVSQLTEDQLANELLPYLTGERKLGEKLEPKVRIGLDGAAQANQRQADDDIQRRARLARGLAECLGYRRGKLETQALLKSLDNRDLQVRLATMRSLGAQLADVSLAANFADTLLQRIKMDIGLPDLERRNAAVAAIAGSPLETATKFLKDILTNQKNATSLRLLAMRLLWQRLDGDALGKLETSITGPNKALLKRALAFYTKRPKHAAKSDKKPALIRIKIEDGGEIVTSITGLHGDTMQLVPSKDFGKLPELRIPLSVIDQVLIEMEDGMAEKRAHGKFNLLMKTGTRLAPSNVKLKGNILEATSFGRSIRLHKDDLRCILPRKVQPRALPRSGEFDQVWLAKQGQKPTEGRITKLTDEGFSLRHQGTQGARSQNYTWTDVETVLFRLGKAHSASVNNGDLKQYVEVDLNDGQRIVGFLLDMNAHEVCVVNRVLGCVTLPLFRLSSMQLSNSGRAFTSFTLIIDYDNNLVSEIDGENRVVWQLADLMDPVDAELTPEGNLLVTEIVDNTVREYARSGKIVWAFTDLDHPTDADRLANRNTLITDQLNGRVIEVTRDKKIVWKFDRLSAAAANFRPLDADRLANGNTLICDRGSERVIEVNPAGKIVWQQKGCKWVYDADRLPNGNTLITLRKFRGLLRGKVFEVDMKHKTIWSVVTKSAPSDADRLPDGTTLVAEDGGVRVYNKQGKVLRKLDAGWAWEANRY